MSPENQQKSQAPLTPKSRPHEPKPLGGLRIVVCRPRDQARSLSDALASAGAVVVNTPVIAITDPEDGGEGLKAALGHLGPGDWLVVTSPNGASRAAAAASLSPEVQVAAIGPGTALVAETVGLKVSLVAQRSIAEGLLEEFPSPGSDAGLVVLARAAKARSVLPEGLRAAGWDVLDVAAYRNIAVQLDDVQRREAGAADGVVFTSSSTVERLVAELGTDSIPPLVVSIGPATSATAREHGLDVTVEASEHTIKGLVSALAHHATSWSSE